MNGMIEMPIKSTQTNANLTKLERTTAPDDVRSTQMALPLDDTKPPSTWSPSTAQWNAGVLPNGLMAEYATTPNVPTNALRPLTNDGDDDDDDGEQPKLLDALTTTTITTLVDLDDRATTSTDHDDGPKSPTCDHPSNNHEIVEHDDDGDDDDDNQRQRDSLGQLALVGGGPRRTLTGGQIVRRFQKFDSTALSSAPSPDVKIGQRVAYKEYYGNEFGTIRWIGRVPQISPDWTVGVEFDNAIGEGDGSLNGRRYFIAKDCFAKFLALSSVTLVDQHVGRPEPGTMISVMSAAVRPGQMISIQRVSTVHVQHCFLNAPHRRPGAEFLAVNTRLHCQCPNCGPCAHVVKPPRTQRLVTPKNATHMCQFSTYTCCGMESSDEALCTYTGNKISSLPPPPMTYATGGSLPPLGNSWMDGSGYLSQLQAEQRKLMPEEYRLGAAPEDAFSHAALPRRGSSGKRRAGQQNSMPSDAQSPATCDSRARDTAMSASLNAEVNKHHNHHHRHKHHHHHHHHHKQRHKSPVTTGQTTGEEQVVGVAPKQQPVYVNLSGGGQPGALIDMHDDEDNEKVNPETGALDDDEPAAARLSGNGHSGRQTSGSNRYDDDDDNQEPSEDEDRRLDRALRAVQYRDSIENRYLFPTDDIIDSLLEADLETLSQARYGSAGRRNERSRGRSSASSSTSVGVRRLGRGRGARDKNQTKLGGKRYRARSSSDVASGHSDGRPNPILQRLRSLVVSCMSAASDGNATAAVASSSKSNRQAAYTTLGRPDSRAQQQPASSRLGANSQGSSRPLSAWRDPDADCCHCRHQQASRASACSTAFAQQTTITNEIITTTNGALAFADELDHGHGPATVPEQANKASPALLGPDHDHDPRLASNHLYSNDPNLDPFECDKPASHQFRAEPRRQKLICSHAAAGRRARGASGARRPAPSSRACRHAKQRHASSSSDCGFSSASQNSINVSQHTSGAQQQQQPPRSRLDDLEKRAIDDLYQKLASRLANHLSAASQKGQTGDEFSHDELLKLKAALLEMHSETCCLHQGSAGGTSSDSPLSAGQEFKEGEGKLTGGGSAQDCALPRAFKLKLSLSINPETTIAPQGD